MRIRHDFIWQRVGRDFFNMCIYDGGKHIYLSWSDILDLVLLKISYLPQFSSENSGTEKFLDHDVFYNAYLFNCHLLKKKKNVTKYFSILTAERLEKKCMLVSKKDTLR